jgi:hypothetical protein
MKKYITLVNQMMADELLNLSKHSLRKFAEFIQFYAPIQVEITSAYEVKNHMSNGTVWDSLDLNSQVQFTRIKPLF